MFKSMPVVSAAWLTVHTGHTSLVLYVWEALGPLQLSPHKMAVVWKGLGCFLTCLVCCGVVSTPELEGLWMAVLKQNCAKVSNHALLESQDLIDVTHPSWCDTPFPVCTSLKCTLEVAVWKVYVHPQGTACSVEAATVFLNVYSEQTSGKRLQTHTHILTCRYITYVHACNIHRHLGIHALDCLKKLVTKVLSPQPDQ